jgi:hypothetical protein
VWISSNDATMRSAAVDCVGKRRAWLAMAFFPQLLSAYRAELNVPIVHGALAASCR